MLDNTNLLKRHFGWQLAICQHPMYLLIDEDRGVPEVGERVPPWGAQDASAYVERVRSNLGSLGKYADLRLNYEFSGVEMEAMAQAFPNVITTMRKRFREQKLDFIGGTYSQPHAQIIGSESNWRQIEEGLRVFRTLFGKRVKVHFLQETGLHQQMPQILKQFGYDFMVLPPWPWAFEVTGGKFEMVGYFHGVDTIAGDEFLEAEALDGSILPVYAKVADALDLGLGNDNVKKEFNKDLYAGPPLWTHFPDMIEVDDALHRKFAATFEFVLIEQALRKRLPLAPPRARGRIYTYWSYVEGVWAEELLRTNRVAEETALLAEMVCSMARLAGKPAGRTRELQLIWQGILKAQHHDIYWAEVTDLRRKAIQWLQDGIGKCRRILSQATGKLLEKDDRSVAFFNGLPAPRKCLVDVACAAVPGGKTPFQEHDDRAFGFVKLPAGGMKSFELLGRPASRSRETDLPREFSTKHYRVVLSACGLIEGLRSRAGRDIVRAGTYQGGEIRALMGATTRDNRNASLKFFSGDVAFILERNSTLGRIPVRERYFFFRSEPLIKVEVEFAFNGDAVGVFWLDETKLNIYYPTAGSSVYHDIPFGYVQGRENRPLLAINWVYCGGLVYVNRGNVKHWVRAGVLANMIAWGGNTFSNRMHHDSWANIRQYDLRLYGRQKIEYYLLPSGKFDGNRISAQVQALTFPVFSAKGRGATSFYRARDRNRLTTAVYEKSGKVLARGYQMPCRQRGRFRDWEIFNQPIKTL